MTHLIQQIGEAMHGADWVRGVAHTMGCSEDQVRQYAAGAEEVPPLELLALTDVYLTVLKAAMSCGQWLNPPN